MKKRNIALKPPPAACPPPPSSPSPAPPVLALPTLRPHLPHHLPLLPLVGRTSCRRLCLRGKRVPPVVGEQLRDICTVPTPGGAGKLPRLLQDGRPEGLLLAPPLGAVLEKMLPGLDAVLATAGGVRSAGCPSQILAGQAVPRLQLALVGLRHVPWGPASASRSGPTHP